MADWIARDCEAKWQRIWENRRDFETDIESTKPKAYILVEFPYPSAAGLHVGHPRSYVAMDIVARKRRMQGFEVLFPIGFDAFGLPAENYAIKTGVHPRITTEQNIATFRHQLKSLGLSFDWSREINTSEPSYYKWTQWMFLRFFKRGLAYKAATRINWCPSCNTALANEEVVQGNCERCGTGVIRRLKEQWMLRITAYADRLAKDLDTLDFIPPVVEQQRNWIGVSQGAEIAFNITPALAGHEQLRVFTTRPDTIFGATYMVIAPEHPLVEQCADAIRNIAAVRAYVESAARKSDLERTDLATEKTGVPLEGVGAVNPATGASIPIWISDYVLPSYGTGAIMAVPAHDTRDWEFAKRFGLPIVRVVEGGDSESAAYTDTEGGTLVNSGFLNGLKVSDAVLRAIAWLEEKGIGRAAVNYRLKDWVFSRQRYWGEPIPLVKCEAGCGWVPVPESELPLLLPDVAEFRTSSGGESPLVELHDWVNTKCPNCGGPGRRETDTMPQWAGSCWYYLRYIDPANGQQFADPKLLARWAPVDWYNGGMEHTTLHLLYSRFWHKVLFDEGLVPTPEPYRRRTSHGMILGADREKMSKSRGNVVNPDQVIAEHGADSFRLYEMYLGDFDKTAIWNDSAIIGTDRFLRKTFSLLDKVQKGADLSLEDSQRLHRTIWEVGDRIERMKFNTAVSSIIELVNELSLRSSLPASAIELLARILSPFAPHLAEEMWQRLGHETPLAREAWPEADAQYLKRQTVPVAVQIGGRTRGSIEVAADASEDAVLDACFELEAVRSRVSRPKLKRVVYVPGRIVNLIGS